MGVGELEELVELRELVELEDPDEAELEDPGRAVELVELDLELGDVAFDFEHSHIMLSFNATGLGAELGAIFGVEIGPKVLRGQRKGIGEG